MKFTYSWLKDHLDTNADAKLIADKLCNIGFEVEGLENTADKLKDIVVAKVVECAKHPNAEKLSLCKVDDGSGKLLQIVCGARNVHQGMFTALVHVGGMVPKHGKQLDAAKIREIESQGMLCSFDELNLENEDEFDGIIELETTSSPGELFSKAFKIYDYIFDISIPPNRGDCFSVRGIARELAAAGLGTLKPVDYSNHFRDAPLEKIDIEKSASHGLDVVIKSAGCGFFHSAVINGIKNTTSPIWIQKRLEIAGQKPIDALVDITNFLNFDLGQPTHVYDLNNVKDHIIVRNAFENEKITALSNQSYSLQTSDLVIADNEKPLTIAGIMGGQGSGCCADSTKVLFEVAYFDNVFVAKTGQRLVLKSESRSRFERGVDPCTAVLEQGLALIKKICGGEIVGIKKTFNDSIKLAGLNAPLKQATLTKEKLDRISGDISITLDFAKETLQNLGFKIVDFSQDKITVSVPSWRHDVSIEEDLIEEVVRFKGYNNFPISKLPLKEQEIESDHLHEIRTLLCNRGFNEVYTFPFLSKQESDTFSTADDYLEVVSPLNIDMAFLRCTVLPSLLKTVLMNQKRSCKFGAFFEIGSGFKKAPSKSETEENIFVSCVRFGQYPKNWLEKQRDVDVFDIKADTLSILDKLGLSSFKVEDCWQVPKYFHPNKTGTVVKDNKNLGYFGEIHPKVLSALGINLNVVGLELNLNNNVVSNFNNKKFSPFSPSVFQPVTKDFSFKVDKIVSAEQLQSAISCVDELIESVRIFDVFESSEMGTKQKSFTIQVLIQPQEKTLDEATLKKLSELIIKTVEEKCGGELRGEAY